MTQTIRTETAIVLKLIVKLFSFRSQTVELSEHEHK